MTALGPSPLDQSIEVEFAYFMLAMIVAGVLIYALYTESFPLRVRGISRAQEPFSYWGVFVLYFGMFLVAVIKSFGF
jgi:hypothetical protein